MCEMRRRIAQLARMMQMQEASHKDKETRKSRRSNEKVNLQSLLDEAKRAKLEAMEITTLSKQELVAAIRRLQDVLFEAKVESDEKDARVLNLEKEASKVQQLEKALEDEKKKVHILFQETLKLKLELSSLPSSDH